MSILQELLDLMPIEPVPVRRILVGVHWILVSSLHSGLGSTLTDAGPHGETSVREVGHLHEKSAQELARLVLSNTLLEASIGVAALNSLIKVDENRLEEVNAAEVIVTESRGKNLVVVGHFPFINRIKEFPRNCWVLEKDPHGEDLPEEAAGEVIPKADVVAITGTALINHTMDRLLALCKSSAMVMVLGPSTPLSPVLFNHGITYISGSCVMDEEAAFRTIQEGGTFQQMNGVRRVTMRSEKKAGTLDTGFKTQLF